MNTTGTSDIGGDVTVRPYEVRDRRKVRDICYRTGYMGDPIDWQWRDQPSFADLFTSYYTDAEPESALVAGSGGEVAGYLLGCLDTARAWPLDKILFRHVFRRGIALRPGTAGFVWRSLGDSTIDALRRRLPQLAVRDSRWPAHLHIDLLPSLRGRGVGAVLVRRWLDILRASGVAGCHVETLGENTRALSFFESMGFTRVGEPANAPGLRSRTGGRHTVQLLVQQL